MALKEWSENYFRNELIYDGGQLYLLLSKVREHINNEATNPVSFEREFDIIVKIEDLEN